MNKLCRNALASCLAATFAVGGGIAVPAASGASLEQDTAVAGMAVSLDNYYASSQTPEADIMDYIRYIVASAQEKKIIPVFTVNATTKEDGSVVFGTSLVSKDASEKEEGLVSVMASLNVRNKPSVSSNVIGYLYSNCVVSIYDTVDNSEGSWYLIKSGDVEGYVSSDYVLTGAAAKASDEDLTNRYAKVKANTAVVYSSASSSADSVGSVYKDGDYKVLAIQNGFVKIAVNEEFAGFVKAEDVSLYTRHAEAVAITDQMVKNQLDSYLVDIRDAEAIFEKRMAAADFRQRAIIQTEESGSNVVPGCKRVRRLFHASENSQGPAFCAAGADAGESFDRLRRIEAGVFPVYGLLCGRVRAGVPRALALPLLRQAPRPQRRRELPALRKKSPVPRPQPDLKGSPPRGAGSAQPRLRGCIKFA